MGIKAIEYLFLRGYDPRFKIDMQETKSEDNETVAAYLSIYEA